MAVGDNFVSTVSHPKPQNMAGKWQGSDVKDADSEVGQDENIGAPMAAKVAQVSNFPADAQFAEHSKFLHEAMPD